MKKPTLLPCYECAHFFITWEPNFPYGCRGFDIKSRQLPCVAVRAASGRTCLLFKPKVRQRS